MTTDTTLRNALARELFVQNGLGAIVVDPSRRESLEQTWDAPGTGGRTLWLRIADALLPHIDDWSRRRNQLITARSGDTNSIGPERFRDVLVPSALRVDWDTEAADHWREGVQDALNTCNSGTSVDGDDLRMKVAAALIAHDHPEPNPLTRPDDPMVMLHTHPTFHICASALSRADAVISVVNERPPTQWAYDQACKALRAHRERAEVAEHEEHQAKEDLRSTRAELLDAMGQLDKDHKDLTYAKAKLKAARSEHDEFLEDLDKAFGLEDGEESRYSNPEGAAEGIYIDVAAAYKRELDENRAAVARVRRVVERDNTYVRGSAVAEAVRAALEEPLGDDDDA